MSDDPQDSVITTRESVLTQDEDGYDEFRVSGTTSNTSLAASLASRIRQGGKVKLVAIGAQAINQAVKAIPILNSHMANKCMMFTMLPSMEDRTFDDSETGERISRTCVIFRLVPYRF